MIKSKKAVKYCGKIFTLGAASFVNEAASAITLIIFNLIILRISGNTGVAAYGIVANIALMVIAIFTGIAQGIQPLVSRGYGEGDQDHMRKPAVYGMTTALCISILIYLGMLSGSEEVIGLFNTEKNEELLLLAKQGIEIYFIGFAFTGINLVTASYLSAINQTGRAFLISITRGVILIVPAAMILSTLIGMKGIWTSFILTEALTCILSIASLAGEWKKRPYGK